MLKVEARVFTMTRQEAQVDPSMVIGLLPICSIDAYMLIDSDSTHLFIFIDFFKYINKEVDWLGSQLIVATLVGRPFIVDQVYKDYDITVEGQVLTIDLILINLKEFDTILGMDWLSMHRAKVDCLRKEVVFHTLDGQRDCFIGERNMMSSCMIPTLTINILLIKECEAFLAYVVKFRRQWFEPS